MKINHEREMEVQIANVLKTAEKELAVIEMQQREIEQLHEVISKLMR